VIPGVKGVEKSRFRDTGGSKQHHRWDKKLPSLEEERRGGTAGITPENVSPGVKKKGIGGAGKVV